MTVGELREKLAGAKDGSTVLISLAIWPAGGVTLDVTGVTVAEPVDFPDGKLSCPEMVCLNASGLSIVPDRK